MQKDKKGILILSHGSNHARANEIVFNLVTKLKARLGTELVEPAFMELSQPDIPSGIKALVKKGCNNIFAYSFFLVKGHHYTNDLPRIIQDAIKEYNNNVEVTLSEPIGTNPRLCDLIEEELENELIKSNPHKDRPYPFHIREGSNSASNVQPEDIERLSMEIIEARLEGFDIQEEHKPIIKRVIHTTADFSFADSLRFHPDAVKAGIEALGKGCNIITDVNMVKAGIIKRYGHNIICNISEDYATDAKKENLTRAAYAMKRLQDRMDGSIIAIGNAPTALKIVITMVQENCIKPALIVGVPVGFVEAAYSKTLLMNITTPYITNVGRRGGSPVACAIVNALMILAFSKGFNTFQSVKVGHEL